MNKLLQLENGIIGSQEDVLALEKKEAASILVVSDTHGENTILQFIVENYGDKADAIIFAGDGINDLISVLDNSLKNKKLSAAIPPVISFVRGNNDPASVESLFNPAEKKNSDSGFNRIFVPQKSVFNACGKNILTVHGNRHSVNFTTANLEMEAEQTDAKIVVFGHTHFPAEIQKNIYIMNPGSLGYPRNFSKPGFAMLQIGSDFTYSTFFKFDQSGNFGFVPYKPELTAY